MRRLIMGPPVKPEDDEGENQPNASPRYPPSRAQAPAGAYFDASRWIPAYAGMTF